MLIWQDMYCQFTHVSLLFVCLSNYLLDYQGISSHLMTESTLFCVSSSHDLSSSSWCTNLSCTLCGHLTYNVVSESVYYRFFWLPLSVKIILQIPSVHYQRPWAFSSGFSLEKCGFKLQSDPGPFLFRTSWKTRWVQAWWKLPQPDKLNPRVSPPVTDRKTQSTHGDFHQNSSMWISEIRNFLYGDLSFTLIKFWLNVVFNISFSVINNICKKYCKSVISFVDWFINDTFIDTLRLFEMCLWYLSFILFYFVISVVLQQGKALISSRALPQE